MTETRASLAAAEALLLLSQGEIAIEGLIPWSSNVTLLVKVRHSAVSSLAIYKPERGETPLWDFAPRTLGKREVAAYLVCQALGWSLVPPTVLRRGPYGLGSVQLFVHAQEDAHYFAIRQGGTHLDDLMRLAAFDALVNNADRKAGHCLLDQEGRLWAIDNALTFHVEPKLRTVVWDFAGLPLPSHVLDAFHVLRRHLEEEADLSCALDPLLSEEERAALRLRLERLIQSEKYPEPGPGRAVPWPLM